MRVVLQHLHLKKTKVIEKGVSGETTDEMCARLPRLLNLYEKKNIKFDLVIILGGTISQSLFSSTTQILKKRERERERIRKQLALTQQ